MLYTAVTALDIFYSSEFCVIRFSLGIYKTVSMFDATWSAVILVLNFAVEIRHCVQQSIPPFAYGYLHNSTWNSCLARHNAQSHLHLTIKSLFNSKSVLITLYFSQSGVKCLSISMKFRTFFGMRIHWWVLPTLENIGQKWRKVVWYKISSISSDNYWWF